VADQVTHHIKPITKHCDKILVSHIKTKSNLLIKTHDNNEAPFKGPDNPGPSWSYWSLAFSDWLTVWTRFVYTQFAVFAHSCAVGSTRAPCKAEHLKISIMY
jgi:hypothetical protein